MFISGLRASGFGVENLEQKAVEFRVNGRLGLGVFWLTIQPPGFQVQGLRYRIWAVGFTVPGYHQEEVLVKEETVQGSDAMYAAPLARKCANA